MSWGYALARDEAATALRYNPRTLLYLLNRWMGHRNRWRTAENAPLGVALLGGTPLDNPRCDTGTSATS